MSKLKPCPFRVHGEQRASLTVPNEFSYNETFMPCMGEKCPCYNDQTFDNTIHCMRDYTYLVIGTKDEKDESLVSI